MGYKLYYFNMMGYGEPIRQLLAAAKVEYEDVRIEREDWPDRKNSIPYGKMPALQLDDGKFICQSSAILRYLARKYGFYGATELEQAKCDEIAGVVADLQSELSKYFLAPNEEAKAEAAKKIAVEAVPWYTKELEAIIKKNGTGYIVGKKLTFADIAVAYLFSTLRRLLSPVAPSLFDKFPEMVKYIDFIHGQPGIKEWIAKRPITPN